MISSQSLLLAVAAIFYEKSSVMVVTIFVIALIVQWFIWYRVIRTRTLITDYHKFNAKFEMSDSLGLSEEDYLVDEKRWKAMEWLAEKTGNEKYKQEFRLTRLKLDFILPILFTVIWIAMIVTMLID